MYKYIYLRMHICTYVCLVLTADMMFQQYTAVVAFRKLIRLQQIPHILTATGAQSKGMGILIRGMVIYLFSDLASRCADW